VLQCVRFLAQKSSIGDFSESLAFRGTNNPFLFFGLKKACALKANNTKQGIGVGNINGL